MLTDALAAHRSDAPEPFRWTARVRWDGDRDARVFVRSHAIAVHEQADFDTLSPAPSAIEYLLAALGADLCCGVARLCARRGIPVDALEATVSGRLNNPLILLGVVGEDGHAGLEEAACILYVAADTDERTLHSVWEAAQTTSPLVQTLRRATVTLSLELRSVL